MANTPILKKRNGAFSVAVFEETKTGKSGDSYISRSVVLQKSYRDQNGEWQRQTINLFDNNVADVAVLLWSVATAIMDLKVTPAEHKESAPAEEKVEPEVDSEIPF